MRKLSIIAKNRDFLTSEGGLRHLKRKAEDSEEQVSALDDDVLVVRCQQELPDTLTAYHELLRRHEPLVFNTCLTMVGAYQDAEEVCQDAFVQVFHKIKQFERRAAFKTWLFRIAYNLCLRRRETINKRAVRERTAGDDFASDLHQKEQAAGRQLELSAIVQEAMDQLEEDQRRIVVLKFVSGLTLQEIAEVQEISLSAAKMRLYRALDRFKEIYLKIEANDKQPKEKAVVA